MLRIILHFREGPGLLAITYDLAFVRMAWVRDLFAAIYPLSAQLRDPPPTCFVDLPGLLIDLTCSGLHQRPEPQHGKALEPEDLWRRLGG